MYAPVIKCLYSVENINIYATTFKQITLYSILDTKSAVRIAIPDHSCGRQYRGVGSARWVRQYTLIIGAQPHREGRQSVRDGVDPQDV